MKMLITFLIFILIVLVGFSATLFHKRPAAPNPGSSPAVPQLNFDEELSVDGNILHVAIANTEAARRQGLSGQPALPEGTGLLFNYTDTKRDRPGFWMKDMKFPIDIIWINNNTVVDLIHNVPPPKANTAQKDLPLYYPSAPITSVLEVAAGWCAQHGVQVGSQIIAAAKK